jgi:hypothetical protein
MGLLGSTCRYPDLGLSVRGIEDEEIGALIGAISDSSVKRDYCVIFERSNGAYTLPIGRAMLIVIFGAFSALMLTTCKQKIRAKIQYSCQLGFVNLDSYWAFVFRGMDQATFNRIRSNPRAQISMGIQTISDIERMNKRMN